MQHRAFTKFSSAVFTAQSRSRRFWRQAVALPSGHRLAAADSGSATTVSTSGNTEVTAQYDGGVASLTLEELQQSLIQRQLGGEGSRLELEQRLAAFLADPAAFPQADCRAVPVQLIGGRLFASTEAARSHLQLLVELLQGVEIEPGHPDFDFLLAVLQRHPRYKEKVFPPVAAFRVRVVEQADTAPIRMFEFRDSQQDWTDFSYRKCLGISATHNYTLQFRDAMRLAVVQQLDAYRLASATTSPSGRRLYKCDACGRRVPAPSKLRVHHTQPSFAKLIKDFCSTTHLKPPPLDGRVPESNRSCFTDEGWLTAWRKYHRHHARGLQLLCIGCSKKRAAEASAARAAVEAAHAAAEAARAAAEAAPAAALQALPAAEQVAEGRAAAS